MEPSFWSISRFALFMFIFMFLFKAGDRHAHAHVLYSTHTMSDERVATAVYPGRGPVRGIYLGI